jgi:hypothetical protein
MQSRATTVAQYLAELPPERRAAIGAVREVILRNLGKGYAEGMTYGMIGYFVPHTLYPNGYHCDPRQPLPFAGLASQKAGMSLYLMGCYLLPEETEWIRKGFAAAGKRLDMGKSCIRFKRVEDLPLPVIAEAIRRVPVKRYIARYEEVLASSKSARKPGAQASTSPTSRAGATPANQSPGKSAAAKPATKPAAKPAAPPATKAATARSTAKAAPKGATARPAARPATKRAPAARASRAAAKPATRASSRARASAPAGRAAAARTPAARTARAAGRAPGSAR